MVGYDERFEKVKEKLARKQHLEALMPKLQDQYSDLLAKVTELREQKAEEQKDVDRLERGSLSAFFLNVVGKKEEKLEKEQKEAYMAAVKCDVAERELAAVEAQIDRAGEGLIGLQGCETEYEALLSEKRKVIAARGLSGLDEIVRTERELFETQKQAVELWEAIEEGKKASTMAEEVLDELDSAENWGLQDAFGGGMFSAMMKYDKLDGAQEKIEELQVQLRKFHTELADVSVESDIRIEISEMLRFADYFFDGLFADFSVMGRIGDAIKQAESTKEKITEVLQSLEHMTEENKSKQDACKKRLERLIAEAK